MEEEIRLEYNSLIADNPDYIEEVKKLPKKMYSGKMASSGKGYFFCYELPVEIADNKFGSIYRWYAIDSETDKISEDMYGIWKAIRCGKEEPRVFSSDKEKFEENRKKVEKYITRNYMRTVQAPIGIKPRLITWLQMI